MATLWISPKTKKLPAIKWGDFMPEGILGQYVYVNPNGHTIMVRMGKNHNHVNGTDFLRQLSAYIAK